MSDDKLRHWSVLGKTDPKHTKGFTRSGGFKGTAIKPIWVEMRLTEHFGPCGIGWGMDEPKFQLAEAGDEILVYCTLRCWYLDNGKPAIVYGMGGDKVTTKRRDGSLAADDEAFKKAMTDALGNAFKHVGVAADVHMGLFDDSKYVSGMAEEFGEEKPGRPPTSASNTGGAAATPAATSAAPSRTRSATGKPPAEHPKRQEALDAYHRLKDAIAEAKTPAFIKSLVSGNKDDLALIKEVSADAYAGLMGMATSRQTELLADA